MKAALLLATLFIAQTSHAAWPRTDRAAVANFQANPLVKKQLRQLKATPKGTPVAIRLNGMGDGCELMETYLVTQQIQTNETFYTSVVSGVVNVSTIDQACAEEGRGYRIRATFSHVTDLVAATTPR